MDNWDLISDGVHEPTFDEIVKYIQPPARDWYQELDAFINKEFGGAFKITFSKCSGKPGWNVKYKRSSKSLCTLYPEHNGFVVLVVISLEMASLIEIMAAEFEDYILDLVHSAKPYNNTLWLMIQINNKVVLDNVKKLMKMKFSA